MKQRGVRDMKKFWMIIIAIVLLIGLPSVDQKEAASNVKKKVIVIDPGHQQKANLSKEPVGPGSKIKKIKVAGGTSSRFTGKPEYKLTLEASLILGGILKSRGYKVVYTRTKNNVNISNVERAKLANKNKADLYIRIHADGSTNPKQTGLSILTPSSKNRYISKQVYKNSLQASQSILKEVKNRKNVAVKGIAYRDDLSGTNWSKVPVTLIELGYMTNRTEDKKLADKKYVTSLATSMADGIDKFTGNK